MIFKGAFFANSLLTNAVRRVIMTSATEYGCLAQLVEHSLDVRVVRDSSSLTSTMKKARDSVLFSTKCSAPAEREASFGREVWLRQVKRLRA